MTENPKGSVGMIELPQNFQQRIDIYKRTVVRQNTEAAKAFLFLEFVRAVFGDRIMRARAKKVQGELTSVLDGNS